MYKISLVTALVIAGTSMAQMPLQWKKGLTGFYNSDIATDNSGNSYIAGSVIVGNSIDFGNSFTGFVTNDGESDNSLNDTERGGGTFKAFVAKYDENGLCQLVIPFVSPEPFGSVGISNIAVNQDGEIMVAGGANGLVDINPGSGVDTIRDVNFIARYSNSGGLLSYHKFLVSTDIYYVESNKNTSSFYVTGTVEAVDDFAPGVPITNLGNGTPQTFFVKYTGNTVNWAFTQSVISTWDIKLSPNASKLAVCGLGFPGNRRIGNATSDTLQVICGSNDDVVFVLNTTDGGAAFAKTVTEVTDNTITLAVELGDDGSLYTMGRVNNGASTDFGNSITLIGGATVTNTFIAKYNTTTNTCLWAARNEGEFSNGLINDIMLDNTQSFLYATTSINGTNDVDFDNSTTNNFTSSGSYDVIILKLSLDAAYLDGIKIGGSGADYSQEIAVDSDNNVIVSGSSVSSNFDFDPTEAMDIVDLTTGFQDAYIAEYGPNFASIENETNISQFQVYPNPTTQFLTITNPSADVMTYKIYNLLGQLMNAGTVNTSVDVTNLSNGTYILQVNQNGTVENHRFIKN